jgi:CopG family transcriptional regulator, nickel-responsive regulator
MRKEYSARTSFTLPPKLLEELDEATAAMGYQQRSRAIQTAVRSLVTDWRASKDAEAMATGAVVMMYDHRKRGVDSMITEVGHHFGRLIVSTLHVHLDGPNCLNTVVVQGRIGKIVELEQHLRNLPGVIQVKVAYVLTGEKTTPGSPKIRQRAEGD